MILFGFKNITIIINNKKGERNSIFSIVNEIKRMVLYRIWR